MIKIIEAWQRSRYHAIVVMHGYEASGSGQVVAKDKLVYKFCHIYRFTRASGVTITTLTTFVVRQ
ncbi:MAG: hypothetical protein ACJ751_05015 [Niastella sp.]|uniref:hypothetical protein n=1 Tax=Niastella sp. TaxID=1869183 RepID=UPI00389A8A89